MTTPANPQFPQLHIKLLKLGTAAEAVAKGIATHAQKEEARHNLKLRELEIARALHAKELPYGQTV